MIDLVGSPLSVRGLGRVLPRLPLNLALTLKFDEKTVECNAARQAPSCGVHGKPTPFPCASGYLPAAYSLAIMSTAIALTRCRLQCTSIADKSKLALW